MLYMVIERFKENAVPEIYRRFREKGRMMPDGLELRLARTVRTDLRLSPSSSCLIKPKLASSRSPLVGNCSPSLIRRR
jgi:hypothetical protein